MKDLQKTSNAKKGGLFVGKSHAKGGIPAIVVDTGQPIEVEGGEVIINKHASKKYWKELSKINQSAGNGVPIPPPIDYSNEVSSFKGGGKITMSAIRQGTEMEMEHQNTINSFKKSGVTTKEVARRIAQDHLNENPNYYKIISKLKLAKGGEIICRSCGWDWHEKNAGTDKYICHECNEDNSAYYKKGGNLENLSLPEQEDIYEKWKSLVNMSKSELLKFYNSKEGKEAGLSREKASELGIDNGRTSARWILKMKDIPFISWSPEMWKWAKKQISFIKRMSGNRGKLYDEKGNKTRKHTSLLIWGHNPEKYKLGGRTIAQTPAPKNERIYGSKVNPSKSSESKITAKNITLSEQTIESINNLLKNHNTKTQKTVDLNTAKAVVRRGMGAYSSSHRPTISGGLPNSRVAWGLARLKAFLFKVKTGKSKSGKYSQDNDLIEDLGYDYEKFAKGGQTNFQKEKISYVMREFKNGTLYSSTGDKVTDKEQAIAIALSEAKIKKYAKGSKISSKSANGDCYYVAGTIALNEKLPKVARQFQLPNFQGTPYVVHSEVLGQGDIKGLRYGHAWIEDDIFVYDYSNGREIIVPKQLYYHFGDVKEIAPKYFKYTFKQAVDKMLNTGHYGSWDLKTESGL